MFNDVMPAGKERGKNAGVRVVNGESSHNVRDLRLRLFPVHSSHGRVSRKTAKGACTRVRIDLPERSVISVAVHMMCGRRVRLLAATVMDSGRHHAEWDGRDDRGQFVPAGAYLVKVEAAGENGALYRASARATVTP